MRCENPKPFSANREIVDAWRKGPDDNICYVLQSDYGTVLGVYSSHDMAACAAEQRYGIGSYKIMRMVVDE